MCGNSPFIVFCRELHFKSSGLTRLNFPLQQIQISSRTCNVAYSLKAWLSSWHVKILGKIRTLVYSVSLRFHCFGQNSCNRRRYREMASYQALEGIFVWRLYKLYTVEQYKITTQVLTVWFVWFESWKGLSIEFLAGEWATISDAFDLFVIDFTNLKGT